MPWSERQRTMLREMGIRLWAPEAGRGPGSLDESPSVERPQPVDENTPSRVDAGAVVARAGPADAAAARLPGLAPADWLVVAEPLDAADPRQEQLLDNMLRAIGVGLLAPNRERRAVFLPLPLASGSSATSSGAASASRESAFAIAIDAVAPHCILAFGRAAAAALLGDDAPIGGLRSRVHTHGSVAVVVTFSLPFLLRHPAEKAKAWADLCLAVATVSDAGSNTESRPA